MKIAIVTDAWYPQINGVVHTLTHTKAELERLGHGVEMITPALFRTIACPTYPEIRLALRPKAHTRRLLETSKPDAIHIATEGTLGLAARRWCIENDLPFTTSFHTRLPEYVQVRFGIPLGITYRFLRWFHGAARATMVATASLKQELQERGFTNLVLWSRGVDTALFRPREKDFLKDPRPIFLYAGRVAVEKNIEAFLKLDLPGTKYVIGDGPDLPILETKYPHVKFTGFRVGEALAQRIAAADVFVFPSRTDTFGLVVIEALACGVPVAAFPVQGPGDIITDGVNGYLNEDLGAAAMHALKLDAAACRMHALNYTWAACAQQFLANLRPISGRPQVEAT